LQGHTSAHWTSGVKVTSSVKGGIGYGSNVARSNIKAWTERVKFTSSFDAPSCVCRAKAPKPDGIDALVTARDGLMSRSKTLVRGSSRSCTFMNKRSVMMRSKLTAFPTSLPTTGHHRPTRRPTGKPTAALKPVVSGARSLFFSEVAEGSANHKYLEIFNPTCGTVDLSKWTFPSCANGCATANQWEYTNRFKSTAKIAPGQVYVICHPSASASIRAVCDQTLPYLSNGNDAYGLVDPNGRIVDIVGSRGTSSANFRACGQTFKEKTFVRKPAISKGNKGVWAPKQTAATCEWVVHNQNTWTHLHKHTTSPGVSCK
jgi:hypothetical protein